MAHILSPQLLFFLCWIFLTSCLVTRNKDFGYSISLPWEAYKSDSVVQITCEIFVVIKLYRCFWTWIRAKFFLVLCLRRAYCDAFFSETRCHLSSCWRRPLEGHRVLILFFPVILEVTSVMYADVAFIILLGCGNCRSLWYKRTEINDKLYRVLPITDYVYHITYNEARTMVLPIDASDKTIFVFYSIVERYPFTYGWELCFHWQQSSEFVLYVLVLTVTHFEP